MTPAGLKAIGYVRASTVKQGDSGLGLEAQEAAIRSSCASRGWGLVEVVSEVKSTGKSRPMLNEVLDRLTESGGVLVVAKDDRVSRSTVETLLLHERANREGWHFFAANMPNVDTTTPDGKFMATVFAAFAELERARIRERTRDAMAAAKAKGIVLGRPRSLDAPGRSNLSPERKAKARREREAMEAALPLLRSLRGEGLSYRKIADAMNERGVAGPQGGRWWDRTVRLALINYGEKP